MNIRKFQLGMLEIAHKVASVPFMKTILKPVYYPFKKHIQKQANKAFRTNALKTLEEFCECLEKNGFHYTLAFGTLLGAVREKGFIKHDLDIDVALWADEYSDKLINVLVKEGFNLDHQFLIDGGRTGREQTFGKNGVYIDIFYFFPAISIHPYCCDFIAYGEKAATHRQSMEIYGAVQPRRVEMPMSKNRILANFEGLTLYIPSNANELLKYRYGDDFMIPNSNWGISSHDDHIVVWKEKKGIYSDKFNN